MKLVRVLHISDLHRGTPWDERRVGDHKDVAVSPLFASELTSTMESDFIDSIVKWQKEYGAIDVIACTGDLGNKGDSEKIEEGVQFIKKIQESLLVSEENVLICPGNHDVNRVAVDSEVALAGFKDALLKFNFKDYRKATEPFFVKGVPFIVVNSCLGASEHSLFIEKYKQLMGSLKPEERKRVEEELRLSNLERIDDCLDIPAITKDQRLRIRNSVQYQHGDFFIMLSHHSITPYNSVEIRPYATVIDAGKTLYDLFELKKNVLILHGHIHFSSALVSYESRMKTNLFVSSIGAGLFDGGKGSSVNIIEIFSSDAGEHVITKVYEYEKNISGFSLCRSYVISSFNKRETFSSINSVFERRNECGLQFSEIVSRSKETEKDVLRTILQHEDTYRIDRKGEDDCSQWIVYQVS